jgi:hypothetical protein
MTQKFVDTFNTKGISAANKELERMGGNIQGLNPAATTL